MSIVVTAAFENPGQPDDKKITLYNLEIVENEKGLNNTFIIRNIEANKGLSIKDDLILNAATTAVARSKELNGLQVLEDDQGLQAHQITIYAQRLDEDFDRCSFREYYPTKDGKAVIDFTKEGGAKIAVNKDYVERQIAQLESWKRQELNLEKTTFAPEREIVPNPNLKREMER